MIRHFLVAAIVGALPTASYADGDFGTREEAKLLANAMIAVVEAEGIEAAVSAMHDPQMPFASSGMGVNLFAGSTVIADNREPETIAADYADTSDLTGTLVWPLITAAAAVEGDAELRWYHYDTQEEYGYKCYSKRAANADATVMVCR